jgi:hypothetical protein
MNIIQLVYAWPSEARYSCDPENYDGWAIEDHGLEMGSSHIQIGDQRTWEKHRWIVATVQPYTSQNGDSIFEIAILTLDGNPPQSTDPAEGERCTFASPPAVSPLAGQNILKRCQNWAALHRIWKAGPGSIPLSTK